MLQKARLRQRSKQYELKEKYEDLILARSLKTRNGSQTRCQTKKKKMFQTNFGGTNAISVLRYVCFLRITCCSKMELT